VALANRTSEDHYRRMIQTPSSCETMAELKKLKPQLLRKAVQGTWFNAVKG